MQLSIITINRNNVQGLRKTMESVFGQTFREFEYIIVDGNSTDGSVDVIQRFDDSTIQHFSYVSEPDNGIYHAMNKGIKLAKGEYIQFLNSGDCLVNDKVVETMLSQLVARNSEPGTINILYGNMLKPLSKRVYRDKGFAGRQPTMLDFYRGTLNHSPAYIKRDLFDTYGLYDETLKIVSDWKWYLQVIALNKVKPHYVNIDVTLFDMNGISNENSNLDKAERKKVLSEILPVSVLADYERWASPTDQLKRINRYWITRKGFWLVERGLFKWEKWKLKYFVWKK